MKVDDIVICPADRGDKPYRGQIVHVGDSMSVNYQGVKYKWITVQHPRGSKHVWPSNRLGFKV